MATKVELNMLKELRNSPLQLKTALYNISIATELKKNGLSVNDMEILQENLQDALNTAYRLLKTISLNTYCFIYDCYLNEDKS